MKILNDFSISVILVMLSLASGCQGQEPQKQAVKKTETKVSIEHLTVATFKTKVFDYQNNKDWKFSGDKPCIIDFYADWCGPCRALAPTIEQIANEYNGKINVYKVNVDEQPELANTFGISGIPAVLFCPQTGKPQMSTGLISKVDFVKAIKEILIVDTPKSN